MILKEDNEYWNDFYAKKLIPQNPSSFAQFVLPYINKFLPILELGCGNGRDAFFFHSQGFEIYAIDASDQAIRENRTKVFKSGLDFITGDFTNLPEDLKLNDKYFGNVYSRFTLHSIVKKDFEKTIKWVFNYLQKGGKLFIEARSTHDPLYGIGQKKEDDAYINTHYRRFLNPKETYEFIINLGFKVTHFSEDFTSSWYKDDHAVVLRIIAEKP